MTKGRKIAAIVAGSIGGLILLIVVAAVIILQTPSFQHYVRDKIVSITEQSTGGKVELQAFNFNLWHLRSTMYGFVLHGNEPAGSSPFFQARKLEVGLSLFSGLYHTINLRSLTIDDPRANVIVYADGTTNVPSPKTTSTSSTSPLQTVVDLAIGHFEIRNGIVRFADRKTPFDAMGDNLRAQLDFNSANKTYQGRLSTDPLKMQYGHNQVMNLSVVLPVVLGVDKIEFNQAKIATKRSQAFLSGAMTNFKNPEIHVKTNGDLALLDLQDAAGIDVSDQVGKTLPGTIKLDATATITDDKFEVTGAHLQLGESSAEASGVLKRVNDGIDFHTTLKLGELAKIFKIQSAPQGTVKANGTAELTMPLGYQITGSVEGNNLSFQQGTKRISNIDLSSRFIVNNKEIQLPGIRLSALGGEFTGDASLQNMRQLKLDGKLKNFDLNTLSAMFMEKPLDYGGAVSGTVHAEGDLKAKGLSGLQAEAHLNVTPDNKGMPVSGTINAKFNGATNNVEIADSHLSLPHSRVDLSGTLGKQLDVQFKSTNLNDFLPLLQATSETPVNSLPLELQKNGTISFNGTVTGSLDAPKLQGQLQASNVTMQGRTFDRITANLTAGPNGATLQNAQITRGASTIQLSANIGLKNWKLDNAQALSVDTTIRNGQMADLLALIGQPDLPITGTVNADVHLNGSIGNPLGNIQATITNGVAYDQPFERAQTNVTLADRKIVLSSSDVLTAAGRVQMSGAFTHPADSFSTGQIQAQVNTNQVQLGQLAALRQKMPGLAGTLETNGQFTGALEEQKGNTQFLLKSVNADVSVAGLQMEGQDYGNLSATARTSGNTVNYDVKSDLAGSSIAATGHTELQPDYPTTATANIDRLPLERVLTLAGKSSIPASGMLSGRAEFSGTIDNPNASVNMTLANAKLYGESLDRLGVEASYTNQLINVPRFEVVDGPARIQGSMRYTHAAGDLQNGTAQFQIASNALPLERFQTLEKYKPGLSGTLELKADGAAKIRQVKGSTEFLLTAVNANANASRMAIGGNQLGGLRLVASTNGDRVSYTLNSDFTGAKIEGRGETVLQGNYQTQAQLSFSNVTYAGVRPLISSNSAAPPPFTVAAAGQLNVNGPAADPLQMSARLAVNQLEFAAKSLAEGAQSVALKNDQPIVITLQNGKVQVNHFRIVGPQTEIVMAGTAGLQSGDPLDLTLNADTNLAILQQLSRNIYSSGTIVVRTMVRGTRSDPKVNGRMELKNASLNYIDFPNGISNANGVILFNGTNATIQNLTAESGGGKLSANGFISYGDAAIAYGLKANAKGVRVRYPPGASVEANANIELTGTTRSSLLHGDVVIDRLGFSPRSDFGSLLANTSSPAQVPVAPSGPLAGMRLDINIRTAPDVAFQTSLAENIQASADLHLRGTAATPGMTGRVNVTQGDIIFFGSKYTINQGTVSFYDPMRINPILNIDLETVAKGVTVVLNVAGPVDNMKLTYRSDPPLQFNEVVALLATGRTPTSDPNLVAQQPSTPAQSMTQIGESAIVSQAIANPVSSRLQRVFGVSKLKIDPTFTSGSELPQARLTLQQQISPSITFTYITNLNQTNSQIIRVEWALNPQWLATATREENGRFGVDFFYRKQFR